MTETGHSLYFQAPLRRFIREIADGPFGSSLTSSHYSDEGARVIRLGNIGPARFKGSDAAFIPMDYFKNLRRHEVKPGDLLIAGLGDENNSVGRACVAPADLGPAIVKADCFRVRLDQSRLLHRYAAWALSSSVVSGQVLTLTRGSTRARINLDVARDIQLPVPPLEEQYRIVDFLDGEIARMTAVGDALRRFDRDVRERERAVLAHRLNAGVRSVRAELPSGWQWTPLMHLTDPFRQIMYGIVLPGPNVTDGVPIVKGGDVAANRLSLNSLNRTTSEIEASYARSRLKGGDLVIAIRGSVGEVAVVPAELTGANLTQDAARISINRSVHAEWLRLVLESPLVSHQIQQRVTGATIKGINIWDLKRVLVPTPDGENQAVLAATAGRAIETHEDLRSRVAQHNRLLAERRQALITAAVTGQFDVSTASGRNVMDGVTA
ncbi:restriction endonuclease subunit S [Streptomyces mirabilis]|uniref:restriction endonuclease subunit S n=1 Tax=Streptomyces mirabilis TaxID=68239 RepID=UPI00380D8CA5